MERLSERLERKREQLLDLGPVRVPEHRRLEDEVVALQYLDTMMTSYPPEHVVQALQITIRLLRGFESPDNAIRYLRSWAHEEPDRPLTVTENRAVSAALTLIGEGGV